MKELSPTVDLGTLIFDQIGEVRFTSAFLNSSNEIVVENSRLAAFIEENFVHWPVKSMTLCEDNYEWSLCAELEVPADLDCDDPRWGDDEYHFFRSHNWETNMKLSMTKQPQTQASRKRRQQLTDALLELMRTKGYAQTTVADICREANIPRRTFYHYFEV